MTIETAPDVLIVTVRGTTEPATGSRLLTPLGRRVARSYPGQVRIHSLDYPATVASFTTEDPITLDLGTSPAVGVHNLVALLNRQATVAPAQRLVLLGWSQGAQVIGDTLLEPSDRHAGGDAPPLDPRAADRIVAAALFGNPTFTADEPFNAGDFAPGISGIHPRKPGALAEYSDRLRDYCAAGDIAAQHTPGASVEAHLSYFHNQLPDQAAQFVLARLASAERSPGWAGRRASDAVSKCSRRDRARWGVIAT